MRLKIFTKGYWRCLKLCVGKLLFVYVEVIFVSDTKILPINSNHFTHEFLTFKKKQYLIKYRIGFKYITHL